MKQLISSKHELICSLVSFRSVADLSAVTCSRYSAISLSMESRSCSSSVSKFCQSRTRNSIFWNGCWGTAAAAPPDSPSSLSPGASLVAAAFSSVSNAIRPYSVNSASCCRLSSCMRLSTLYIWYDESKVDRPNMAAVSPTVVS